MVLAGFMGVGKSSVGRLLAERLQRPFVDMDQRLVARFGKPIARVFAEDGEAAFRAAERDLVDDLAAQGNLIIAAGGGTVVDPGLRALLRERCWVFGLSATPADLAQRLAGCRERPLLAGTGPEELPGRIAELLAQRRAAYASLPHHVSTCRRTPAQVAERIASSLGLLERVPGLQSIAVSAPGEAAGYPILCADGLTARAGELLTAWGLTPGPVAVVSHPEVADLHAAPLEASLRAAGYQPVPCLFPSGEAHKTLDTVRTLYQAFLRAGLDRRGAVLGLGGGVVGDVAGFAAATYLRGVPFVQVPTTLLAMVDSSVGGKTGVDLPEGKNLVGAFLQPRGVLVDPSVLGTLPREDLQAGLGEVLKHAIIDAPELFNALESGFPTHWEPLVFEAVQVKVRVVEQDPFERGLRAVLNLGHTFAHAFELESGYGMRHGVAVGVGLVAAAHLGASLGRCPGSLAARIERVLSGLGLPTRLSGLHVDAVQAAMAHDKKRRGRALRFIVPEAIGRVTIVEAPGTEAVRDALARVLC